MRSIQKRLVLSLLAGLGALIVLGGGLLYITVRGVLVSDFDYALLAKVRAITTLPETSGEGINLRFTEHVLPEYRRVDRPEYYQVWLREGIVLSRSPSLGEMSLPKPGGRLTPPKFWSLTLPDGRPGRAVALNLSPADDGDADFAITAVFARDTLRLNRKLAAIGAGILLGGALLAALMAAVIARGVRSGLLPLHALADHVTRIDPESLDTRFPVEPLPVELRPISDQLNRLMDRLHAAFQRERRFTDNVTHELATPIAELRSLSEVALKFKDDPEATAQLAKESLEIALQMQRMVSALLALSRCEAGLYETRREPVRLKEYVDEQRGLIADRMKEKRMEWECDLSEDLTVLTDPAIFKSVLYNLFDNAAEYSPQGGRIRCEAKPCGDTVRLIVSNTQESLAPDDLPRLFEPLWRKSADRSDFSHSGLGLALVKSYSDCLGISVATDLPHPGLFQITLSVPRNS